LELRTGFSCDPVLPRRGLLALAGGVALCGCGPQLAAPRVGQSELAAAQRSIQSAAPLSRTNRAREEEVAMLRRVSLRLAEANDALCRQYGRQGCAFRIGLSTANEPNAFATDTNTVGVTSGMLDLVSNDAELAAVVAHEFGHHLANHISRAGTRTGIGSLAGALIGAYLGGDALAQAGAQLGGGAARLAYSQGEEREADYLAAFMVHRARYDLDQAGQIWVRLAQVAGRSDQPSLLRTHPTGPERLAAWQRTVAEIEASPDAAPRRA
jgi:predicted Zn-dependent protease